MSRSSTQLALIVPGIIGLSFGLVLVNRQLKSLALSILDHIGSFLSVTYFRDGLGTTEEFLRTVDAMNQNTADNANAVNVEFGEWSIKDGVNCARATFSSPIVDFLPNQQNTQNVQVEIVVPAGASFEDLIQQGNSVVIHLPATGDEGFSLRRRYIAKSLADSGIVSIIVQLPFYGHRRLSTQKDSSLPLAEYMPKQSLAAVMETNAIIRWLTSSLGFSGKLAITGISFGGSMSALSSLYCKVPHAVIAHVPANSPADAYVDGYLSRSVAWHKFPDGKKLLYELLGLMDIAKEAKLLISDKSAVIPARTYIQITAMHDQYIPHFSAMKLYSQMQLLPNLKHVKLHLIPGGHGSAILIDYPFYLQCIHEGLEKLIL